MKRVFLAFTLVLPRPLDPGHRANAEGRSRTAAVILRVSQGLPGFSSPDDKGNWTGLDVDNLSRACGRQLQRSDQDQVRAVVGQGSLHGTAVRRN